MSNNLNLHKQFMEYMHRFESAVTLLPQYDDSQTNFELTFSSEFSLMQMFNDLGVKIYKQRKMGAWTYYYGEVDGHAFEHEIYYINHKTNIITIKRDVIEFGMELKERKVKAREMNGG